MTAPTAFIVVTHLLGVGHLVRAAALARALTDAGWHVTLVSGGRPAPLVDTHGVDFVELPPLHVVGTHFATLYRSDGTVADAQLFAERRRLLVASYRRARPDVVVTELYPFGRRPLRAEFDALIDAVRASRPRPALVASIRDILQPPSKPSRIEDARARLGKYDLVLHHGDATIAPLSDSWPVDASLARRVVSTGYIGTSASAVGGLEDPVADRAADILVSAGGSAAGLPLARVAVDAARRTPDLRWHVLIGHGVDDEALDALRAAAPPSSIVERARADFPALLARAKVSVSLAGYNTVLDLAAANARAVLVPFSAGAEREQTIRATALAARGLVHVLAADDLTVDSLLSATGALRVAERPDWSELRRDGAAPAVAALKKAAENTKRVDGVWRRLDAALDDLRRSGRRVAVWLRDDDAVTMTGQLNAYLQKLARHAVPVTLAVIPSQLDPDLARAAREIHPAIHFAAHGWSHMNHAPAGEKRSEFPAARPAAEVLDDLRRGQERLRVSVPDALSLFVPPWNRFAAVHDASLAATGYRAVSTFAKRRGKRAPVSPIRCDTHWDPIDWRAGGGLVDAADLLDHLSNLLAQEREAFPGELEPIGLLTHHLVHDPWIDAFLDDVLERLRDGPIDFLGGPGVLDQR